MRLEMVTLEQLDARMRLEMIALERLEARERMERLTIERLNAKRKQVEAEGVPQLLSRKRGLPGEADCGSHAGCSTGSDVTANRQRKRGGTCSPEVGAVLQ
jgi:hypothetical protein